MTLKDIVTLVGLVVSVIAIVTPILKLTKTMAELTVNVQALKDSLNNIVVKNHEAHTRMWNHNKKQDEVINNHDKRITRLEDKVGLTNIVDATMLQAGNTGSIANTDELLEDD